jgi:hypothetical protein
MNTIIQQLPGNTPLDIIGDIHGYIEPLETLLGILGYSGNRPHPEGRRLVFCGDLVDRGPDSPAVMERVMGMVQAGHAHCILGNHELNILMGLQKHGNAWITNPREVKAGQRPVPDEAHKARYLDFLATLPLVLENRAVRVVHACWDPGSIDLLRSATESVLEVYDHYEAITRKRLATGSLEAMVREERAELGDGICDHSRPPGFYPHIAASDAIYQDGNPVRVTASGKEEPVQCLAAEFYDEPLVEPEEEPFFAGGKWRMVRRMKWWNSYHGKTPVIFGHYWRNFGATDPASVDKFGPDLFAGIQPHHWMGPRNNVYCVDFSIGMRSVKLGREPVGQLAAVRCPEWQVVHDGHRDLSDAITIESGG